MSLSFFPDTSTMRQRSSSTSFCGDFAIHLPAMG
jgi:hypothetical protein